MIKKFLIWIVCFVVVFAAGVSAGFLFDRLKQHPSRRSWLTSQLNLTAEQREKMRKIWSEAMQLPSSRAEDKRFLQQQRDQAIRELLTEEQAKEYESILQNYARNVEELFKQRREEFKQAVEKTKEILTPEQAARALEASGNLGYQYG